MLARPPKPSAAAVRKRRERERQRRGLRCYRLVLADCDMENILDGLVAAGRIAGDETRRAAIEAALVKLIEDFGRRWRERAPF